MLKMIQCDKFIENGQVRPPIIFKRGLNTVLGDEFASNSIGKTTFLMILDFVFGGDDYVQRSIDVQFNIGAHVINFAFEFENELYYYSRSTNEPKYINVCDINYQTIKVITKDEYTKMLSKRFKLDLSGLTLRNAVSRFFRVYGRETLDPKFPLQNAAKEPQYAGIDGLLKMFNRYKPVEEQKQLTEAAERAEKSFKAAQKYNFLPTVRNKTQYEKNNKSIAELEEAIHRLTRDSAEGLSVVETLQAESSSELRQQIKILKRQYISMTNELNSMEIDRIKRHSFQKDYADLEKFFPGVNRKKLEEIENFHVKLAQILKDEFKEKANSLQSMIDSAARQIAHLEAKLTKNERIPHVSNVILTQYAEKLKALQLLQDSNNNYDKKEQLKQKSKELKNQLDTLVVTLLDQTGIEINELMHELNKLMGQKIAPHLTIKDAERYTFSTPNDRGTGSQYKGLILFDLAILALTNLPLLVHDSVLLKQIEDDTLEHILQLYVDTEKQVFIVLDKKGSFSEKAQKILENTTILNLYPGGGELFGHAWNYNN